jgi:hypothetical protein
MTDMNPLSHHALSTDIYNHVLRDYMMSMGIFLILVGAMVTRDKKSATERHGPASRMRSRLGACAKARDGIVFSFFFFCFSLWLILVD